MHGRRVGSALHARCISLEIDPDQFTAMTIQDMRKAIRERRKELWEAQKKCESLRREWLVKVAQDRARISADKDWKKKLTKMIKTAQ